MKKYFIFFLLFVMVSGYAQKSKNDSAFVYKKRVLETTEIDILFSYYKQNGNNAAVCGGIGSENLTDLNPVVVVAIPLNDDDVLTLDANISAYTSASSSNINPFDGNSPADPYVASSGASKGGNSISGSASYSHSSDDRSNVFTGAFSVSSEYDYFSFGFGGSYAKTFNDKNTELTVNGYVYVDTWDPVYPYELRPFMPGGLGLNDPQFKQNTITGNPNYDPLNFQVFTNEKRNSYSLGFGFSQILTKRLQGLFSIDFLLQDGLLSTPFQRVYFSDVDGSFIQDFQLADDIERLPGTRFKLAIGLQANYYINEWLVLRGFYRYYFDDWGIRSQTASIEVPVKIAAKFTIYPSYRFYFQKAANYFAPFQQHLSTDTFYTSDFDLSKFNANQFGLGVTYTDIFTQFHISIFHLKSIDLNLLYYERNTEFNSGLAAIDFQFLIE